MKLDVVMIMFIYLIVSTQLFMYKYTWRIFFSFALRKNFDIWETLSINLDCFWALSINDVNTESTSSEVALLNMIRLPCVLAWSRMLWWIKVSVKMRNTLISCRLGSLGRI